MCVRGSFSTQQFRLSMGGWVDRVAELLFFSQIDRYSNQVIVQY